MRLILLGTNGSIGHQSIKVLRTYKDKITLVGFSVGDNLIGIDDLIKEFKPKYVSFKNEKDYLIYKEIYKDIEFFHSENSILMMINKAEFDAVINALSGFSGFLPTIASLKLGKTVLLANKESLVVGGDFVRKLLKSNKGRLIPIDSEHVAISKCLKNEDIDNVFKIVLTASGGPFYETNKEDFKNITLEKALNHPTWKMGKKITIDSSTMMNKCFEVIEAHYLFDVPYEMIDIMVDRKSFVHSYVIFKDKRIKASVGEPDMSVPIIYAFNEALNINYDYEDLVNGLPNNINLLTMDYDKFSLLQYSKFVLKNFGDSGAVLNAANEEAVKMFLLKKIKYIDIEKIIDKIMSSYHFKKEVKIEDVVDVDKKTRKAVDYLIEKGKNI